VNLRELFRQAAVAIGLIPPKFIVQCLLIYKFLPLTAGAVFARGLEEAAGVTGVLWLTVTLTQYVKALAPSVGGRILAVIKPEAAELYQLKLRRQGTEKQKRFLADVTGPLTFEIIANQLKASASSLLPTVVGVALASLFLPHVFVNRPLIAIVECTLIIVATTLIFFLAQLWLTCKISTDDIALDGQPGAKRGKMAAFTAALQDGDELVKTAEARFQLEIQTNPGPPAYNERGKHYLSCHQFIPAVDDFSQAIKLDENFAEAYENRAAAYAGMKLPNLARKEFAQACRLYTEQGKEGDLQRALDKSSEVSGGLAAPKVSMKESFTTAAFLFNPKKLDQLADMELDRINTRLEKDVKTGTIYRRKAEILHTQGQYGEALLSCNKAISANSEDAAAYRIRAEIEIQQSKIQEALHDYDKAIELNEKDGDAFLGRARLNFIVLQNSEAALKDCTHAMSFSRNRHFQLLRGEILITLDRCELAVSDLTEFIESWERYSALWDAFLLPIFRSIANALRSESIRGYEKRAVAYEKLGQLDKAAQDLARAENLKKITKGKTRLTDKSGQKQ
jgi:tetratricopeptide (TPR) repeat protein